MQPNDDPEFTRVLKIAINLLKERDRSRNDLQERLTARGETPDLVSKVLSYLHARRLINDDRLAIEMAEQRLHSKPIGRRLLAEQMARKGLDDTAIESTLRDWDDQQETELALKALKERWGPEPGAVDAAALRRWSGFLARRGFEQEAALEAIRAYSGVDIDP